MRGYGNSARVRTPDKHEEEPLRRLSVPLGSLLLLLMALLALTACGTPREDHTEHDAATAAAQSATSNAADADLQFIDGMIPHHEGAVSMARLALEEAEHAEISGMAEEIIAAQEAEIGQLRDWRTQWFAEAPPMTGMEGMHDMPGMTTTDEDLDMLRAADPFDAAFIDMMIPHHASAIEMAEQVLETTTRPEIREMAQAIIRTQQAEIDTMEMWRTEWYGATPVQ